MFKKKRKLEKVPRPGLPELPELPKLPDFPGEENYDQIHQLPIFPNNSLGDKFSQNNIKEAITGKKEVYRGYANDFESPEEIKMMQKPQRTKEIDEYKPEFPTISKPFTNKSLGVPEIPSLEENYEPEIKPSKQMMEDTIPKMMTKTLRVVPQKGPDQIFVRLDKFEESQTLLENIKKQVSEITKLLEKTKEIKQDEDEELKGWETELQEIKSNIDKIDKDLFSKL